MSLFNDTEYPNVNEGYPFLQEMTTNHFLTIAGVMIVLVVRMLLFYIVFAYYDIFVLQIRKFHKSLPKTPQKDYGYWTI